MSAGTGCQSFVVAMAHAVGAFAVRFTHTHAQGSAVVRWHIDFVNGMQAVVKGFDARTGGLRVRTETGHTFDVWRYTDRDHGDLAYYPIRPGYASTILKFQGAELRHVTVYLDAPKVPGAAYTALSRVRRGDDFLIGGLVDELHFTPAV